MLKFLIDKLEDVPEALRDHYKEKDGKFVLQVEGAKSQADIDKQLTANQAERTAHAATRSKLKEAEDKLKAFGDTDPEALAEQLQELEALKAAGPNAKAEELQKKANEMAETKYKADLTKATRTIEKLTTERDTAVQENTGLKTANTQRTIDDAVRGAATAAKVMGEAVPDLTILARHDFTLSADGKVLTADGRDPAQWVEDSKKTRPYLWPAAKGAGAGGGGGGENPLLAGDNPFSAKGWNLTKQGQLYTSDPSKAEQLATAAGTKVGGPRPAMPVA